MRQPSQHDRPATPVVDLEQLPIAAAAVDRESLTILAANSQLDACLRTSPGSLVGRSLLGLLPGAEAVTVQSTIAELDGSPEAMDVSLGPWPTGRRRGRLHVSVTDSVLLLTFTDLTAERHHTDAVRADRATLRTATRRTGHDLKAPLTVVAGYARMLADGTVTGEDRTTVLARIAEAAERAAAQVSTMLEQPASELPAAGPVDLAAVAAWLEGLTGLAFEACGGILLTDIHDAVVDVDGGVLRQVLLNLVNNALEHAAHPDRPLRVHVATRIVADGLEVLVSDNGPGIDVDVDGVLRDGDRRVGHGTGLATCRRLAEAMGGWLTAVPYSDGSRFVLWLPQRGAIDAR